MPRFVLLRHECAEGFEKPSHWDLMLEQDGVLLTWELRELPAPWATALGMECSAGNNTVSATRLPDHRLAYLDYEGPISGNRGTVSRVAAGTIENMQPLPTSLTATLSSDSLAGVFHLNTSGTAVQWVLAVGEV